LAAIQLSVTGSQSKIVIPLPAVEKRVIRWRDNGWRRVISTS